MKKYDVKLKSGNVLTINRERYEILRKILSQEDVPMFLEISSEEIIATSMIANIGIHDDGSLE